MSADIRSSTGPTIKGINGETVTGGGVTFPVPIIGIFTYGDYMYAVAKDTTIWRSREPSTEKWERWHGEV